MAKKTISDVLEYLYRNKKRELAEAVIEELRLTTVTTTENPNPSFVNVPHIYTTPTPKSPTNPFTVTGNPDGWMGTTASVDKPEDKEYPTITK